MLIFLLAVITILNLLNLHAVKEWQQWIFTADFLITLGIVLVFYSAILFLIIHYMVKNDKIFQKTFDINKLKGEIAVSLGTICEGLGFFINTRYGIDISGITGTTFIKGNYIELNGDLVPPPMTIYGILFGFLIILWLHNDLVLKTLKKHLFRS
jgi:hypothetical protein